jgi:multimeric flavodoxin WrbA
VKRVVKIVSIVGSPRSHGNSAILAESMAASAERQGARVNRYFLNKLKYQGCQACSACKGKSERCVLKDDLSQVLEDVIQADVIVLATPVYWGEVSGQMKLFLDRTYSFLKPGYLEREDKHRLLPGKKLVWIQVQGAESPAQFGDIFGRYNMFFQQLDYFTETFELRACGVSNVGAVNNRPELIAEAQALGVKLAR